MDLRTGTPVWQATSPRIIEAGALDRDESCDVLVIGSGVSGAMAAFHLLEAGLDVVVVDRRRLTLGSTPASTALIQYEIDRPLIDLAQLIGPAEAQQVYRQTRRTLDDLVDLTRRAAISCDLVRRPTLYLAGGDRDVSALRDETRARAGVGIEVRFVEREELKQQYGIDRPGAIRSEVSFELDPWKLTQQLLRASQNLGARLYGDTSFIKPVSAGRIDPALASTGYSIRFRHLLFASGYETPEQFPSIRSLTQLKSTYALATPVVAPEHLWSERALLWEHASPYFYARTTADNRIVIGGEDEEFVDADRRDGLIPSKTRALLEKLRAVTGIAVERADFAWAGTFAETPDGLPFIGRAPESPHCLLALGYGGNGITFSLLAAQLLRDTVLGQENPASALFGFERPLARKSSEK